MSDNPRPPQPAPDDPDQEPDVEPTRLPDPDEETTVTQTTEVRRVPQAER